MNECFVVMVRCVFDRASLFILLVPQVAKYEPCITILKSIGFSQDGESSMTVAKGKKVVNVAPFVTGRDMIDKWIGETNIDLLVATLLMKQDATTLFYSIIFVTQITTTQIKIDTKLLLPIEKGRMKLNE